MRHEGGIDRPAGKVRQPLGRLFLLAHRRPDIGIDRVDSISDLYHLIGRQKATHDRVALFVELLDVRRA